MVQTTEYSAHISMHRLTANDKHFNPVVDNLSSRLSAHVSSQSGARSWPQAAPHFLALIGIKWLFDLTLHHSAPKFQFREISCSTGIPIHYTSSFLGKSAAGENPSFLVPCPGWHAPHFYKICPYHSYQVVYWLNTYCSVTPRPTKPMIQLATCPDANSTTLWAFDRQPPTNTSPSSVVLLVASQYALPG